MGYLQRAILDYSVQVGQKVSLLEHRGFLPREREFSFRQKKLHRGPVGVSREWHEDNEHLGAIHRPEGARRFSPGVCRT